MPSEPVLVNTCGVAWMSGWPGQPVALAQLVQQLEVELAGADASAA